ncbi:unnamed protein product [Spirodela intermedia]|uniref:Uncharacterized protein n=1 Tax=Spirodela intermedia TaxID=51605 RepID=A0A7I8LIL2_SPIIN|nr:unnamed protein product [Spirodela intermedia]
MRWEKAHKEEKVEKIFKIRRKGGDALKGRGLKGNVGHISGGDNHQRGFCQTDKQGEGRLENMNDGIGLRFKAHSSSNAREWKDMTNSVEEKLPIQMNPIFHRESVFDEVGVSPVEIAKAFMEFRSSSSSDQGIHGRFLKNERSPLRGRGSAANTVTSSDSPMSQICWPGAVLRSDQRYFTPQSQRGRSGLRNTPRTPCPEEIFQSSLTKRKSVKMSDSKGGVQNTSASIMSTVSACCDVFSSSTLTPKRNSESGLSGHQATCSEDGSTHIAAILSRVHPKSSEVAKTILEHLDRTDLLPQKKSFEPKVLTEKKTLFGQFDGTVSLPRDKSLEPKSLIETRTLSQSDVVKELNDQGNKAGPLSLNTSLPGGDVFQLDMQVPKANEEVIPSSGTSFVDSKARQVQKFPSSPSQFSGAGSQPWEDADKRHGGKAAGRERCLWSSLSRRRRAPGLTHLLRLPSLSLLSYNLGWGRPSTRREEAECPTTYYQL